DGLLGRTGRDGWNPRSPSWPRSSPDTGRAADSRGRQLLLQETGLAVNDPLTRRRLLGMTLGAAALAACSAPGQNPAPAASAHTAATPPSGATPSPSGPPPSPHPLGPATELSRAAGGRPQVAL